jgi:hypothetical protein
VHLGDAAGNQTLFVRANLICKKISPSEVHHDDGLYRIAVRK